MDWQPIETAPKDGSWVIVFNHEDGTRNKASIRQWRPWAQGSSNPVWIECWVDEFSQTRPNFEPTHWMPIPKDPQ